MWTFCITVDRLGGLGGHPFYTSLGQVLRMRDDKIVAYRSAEQPDKPPNSLFINKSTRVQ